MASASLGAGMFLELDDGALLRQCAVDHYRSSGPGGQKRNKTSSAVRLRHGPTGLIAIAEEDRSQHVNKDRALRRLREVLALELRRGIDLESYQASDVLRGYLNHGGQLRVSRRNREYPAVMAEVLDVIAAAGLRIREAAERIGVTTAQLVQFLERDPKLWERVNRMRSAAGMKSLR